MMAGAMKAKHQRLILVLLAVAALIVAALLAASALRDEAAYFVTPADVAAKGVDPGRPMRLGGMVVPGSLKRAADGVTLNFTVGADAATTPVRFTGIAPDLFKEGSGVVAEGSFTADGTFVADNLLAKHDENYMPREMEGVTYNPETHSVTATEQKAR